MQEKAEAFGVGVSFWWGLGGVSFFFWGGSEVFCSHII